MANAFMVAGVLHLGAEMIYTTGTDSFPYEGRVESVVLPRP